MLATAQPDLATLLELMPKPPKLPAPSGRVAHVRTTAELVAAVEALQDDTTILLADGVYTPPPNLTISKARVSFRGESGDREKVSIDAQGGRVNMLCLAGTKDCLIADVTFRNSELYGVRIYGDTGVTNTRIINVKFHNIWTRGLKGTHPLRVLDSGSDIAPDSDLERRRPRGGLVQHCLFLCDTPKPWPGYHEPDYISGIDMMGLKDWTFSDNLFTGIRGQNGGGRGAIFIWVMSEDVIAERNLIVNCDRGISFGNPSGSFPQVTRGIVRHNRILGGCNKAIEQCGTLDNEVHHNSIYATDYEYPRSVVFSDGCQGGQFHHNLLHGKLEVTPDSSAKLEQNRSGSLEECFEAPQRGDLRLTAQAGTEWGARW